MVTAGNSRKCIFISTLKTSWDDAKRLCEDDNAYLLTFSSGMTQRILARISLKTVRLTTLHVQVSLVDVRNT